MRREPLAQCAYYLKDGVEARLCPWCRGLVKALAAQAGIFGDLRHVFGASDITERQEQKFSVFGFQNCRHVFGNGNLIRQVTSGIERM